MVTIARSFNKDTTNQGLLKEQLIAAGFTQITMRGDNFEVYNARTEDEAQIDTILAAHDHTKRAIEQIDEKRVQEYGDIGSQLDKLWHDIDDGIFGEGAKLSTWYVDNKAVKDNNPK